jgi:hypothetical protein
MRHFVFVRTAVRDDKKHDDLVKMGSFVTLLCRKCVHGLQILPNLLCYCTLTVLTFLFIYVETARLSEKVLRTLKVFFISFYDFVLDIFRSNKY